MLRAKWLPKLVWKLIENQLATQNVRKKKRKLMKKRKMNSVTQTVCFISLFARKSFVKFLREFLEKIKKRYGNLGNIVRVKINRSNNNMGIALAGHRDRHEMGCFIAGLNPKGAAISQNFKIGDEILEVSRSE